MRIRTFSLAPRLSAVGALCAALALPSLAQPAAPADTASRPASMQPQGMMGHGHGHGHGGHDHAGHHGRHDGKHHGHSAEERAKRHAAHAAAIKQKLQLTPAQESAWTTFTTAMQPGNRPAMPERGELAKLSTPERLDRMRAVHAQHGTEMERRAEAVKTFYATLTPEQQKTFDAETAQHFGRYGMGHGKHSR